MGSTNYQVSVDETYTRLVYLASWFELGQQWARTEL